MASVSVRGVSKLFGSFKALDDISIEFADGGFYGLLGPSGSGKTTLLRLIAGFDFPDSGEIEIGGEPVGALPAEKRDIGMMFQSYALFPNMSVFDNVAFGLMVRNTARAEIVRRVGEALELVRLTGLDDRKPHQLSGGQRQRVALARAIVFHPRVLLLDEPLSALDKALRVGMQVELKRIQREIGITTIFVTHDQEEALTLSDRIGVLRDGRLVQEGAPKEIYDRPESAFAATFLGDANLFRGRANGDGVVLADGSRMRTADAPGKADEEVVCAVRPERIEVVPADGPADGEGNMLDATVSEAIFAGNSMTYLASWQDQTVKVIAQNRGAEPFEAGARVRLVWRPADTVVVTP
ncbi:ABC transporter ATP-binding protein [Kaustia mangrovi]|uniref:Spermidine/putrescine import ATP-binding protein PotA n=1 Tax=Kaustia mangrovi TaxID=2593653 RepID=A0A7S8HBV9_9HYPH|nr:ABC transporter ATP-binding protein [Kaustia mangrovi]QPC42809.1 ABC transporter ATP-binding protein [Kaustia mangrovi]